MKNVTKILTAAILCAALFASTQRTDALGGNPAFWPGDEANIVAFPAQMNNHAYVQLTGVGGDSNSAALLWNNEGTTWGFDWNSGSDDWFNMKWGNGDMGVAVGILSNDDGNGNTVSGHNLGWGKAFSWGEIGVRMSGKSMDVFTDAVVAEDAVPETLSVPDTGNCDDPTTAAVETDAACGDAVEYDAGSDAVDAEAAFTTTTDHSGRILISQKIVDSGHLILWLLHIHLLILAMLLMMLQLQYLLTGFLI